MITSIAYQLSASISQYQDTLINYTQDSLVSESPTKQKPKGSKLEPALGNTSIKGLDRSLGNAPTSTSTGRSKGVKLDLSLFDAPTGTSTGTALPFAPDGYGTDPVDKYLHVLPKEFDHDGSKMREARASYKEAHKYDIDSPNTIVALIAILITIVLFFFMRKGILKESRDKKAEITNISEKKAASNVSSTSPYKITYKPSSK